MNRATLRALLALTIACGLGCGRAQDAVLPASEQDAIRTAFSAYLSAANAGDAAAWARLYTTDAVMMPPNTPGIEGRDSIQGWLSMLPTIRDARGAALEVQGIGQTAYVRGTYAMTLEIPGVPQPVSQEGKLLQIYAKQADGSWLLARDIWNANAP